MPLDIALVVLDIGQDHVAQEQENEGEQEIGGQRQLDHETEQVVRGHIGHAVGRARTVPALAQVQVGEVDVVGVLF
ncbi:hypothetical protein LP420_10515 [Massilia sp. B-10]|nr:hypothetical protein LP420_10515 [Massilia sp. B-10]